MPEPPAHDPDDPGPDGPGAPVGSTPPGAGDAADAVGPAVPNPAGPDGRPGGSLHAPPEPGDEVGPDGVRMSRASRRLVAAADALPDWAGSVRFRLTALYSLVLFGLAAFAVAGVYAVLAARLNHEAVYRTYHVTRVRETPLGLQLTPTEIQAEYRSVEQLANARALGLLRTYSLSALGLLFLASLGVGWIVAGRVLGPIGRITSVAREIEATDLSRRIALRGPPDELKRLADTFDAMLARLDDAFEGQQRFIQETSHELRNPLAVIRTNLDVALADPNASADDLRRAAEVVERNAARMSRLVDDLLVYARRGAPAAELVPVDLAHLVAEAADEFGAPAQARHLALAAGAAPGTIVIGDRGALRRALANLLSNAVRLAPEGSTVAVGAGTDAAGPWLSVADEGPGLSDDDRAHVFERFWRGDRNAAREEGRSGLGLAIVDQIARDHGGTAEVVANDRGGSTFVLRFPTPDV